MKHQIQPGHHGLALFAAVGLSCGVAGLASSAKPAASAQVPPAQAPTAAGIEFFETKVRPVLAKNCYACHGPKSQMASLRLDSRAAILKTPALISADVEKSLLVHVVRYTGPVKMPPVGKLKDSEIADLETWVRMGAPWPTEATKPIEKAPLWSLLPVRRGAVPKVKERTWVRTPIDAFILANIEAKKLKPALPADRRTLLRRVTYDLIGLPPTASETDAFLTDKSPTAYEKVVDRLLASPHYGERWARLWLDVARYADTKGYVFNEDRTYNNAYTYREWVIRAFNQDLPYDRFVTQQLAADRLPEVRDGDDKSALAALGFLTIGRRFLNSTPDIIDDRIDVTMRGLQAFTVSCARCHDHKFDPIPTQDYYSLYSVFNSSEERSMAISERSIREPWEKYNARVSGIEDSIRTLVVAQTKRLRGRTDLPGDVKGVLQGIREETVPEGNDLQKLATAFESLQRAQLDSLQKELREVKQTMPPTPEFAMAMVDSPHPGDGVVFKRGNPGNPGPVAPRRFLLALSKGAERPHWTEGSGRLELAKAIASRDNPLTARVFVNRVWMNHFGAGLVRTPSDFGRQGEPPTHPELLDYLATTFMDGGWSIKKLHRLIVTSATYRQGSEVSAAVTNADPDNRTWCRMPRRRLDLEQMRDSLMNATGRLDLAQVGGKSVDLWSQPFSNRRALYGFIERQNLPGIFRTFDFASPDSTSARRFQTTVPQQALFFLNSPFAIEAARQVAERAEVINSSDNAQRVRRLYRLLFERLPDADETAAGVAYLSEGQPKSRSRAWRYGYGGLDGKNVSFTPFTFFVDGNYRATAQFPSNELGYVTLNAQGGHPGRDGAHATILRWVAPQAMTIRIGGVLRHGQKAGDGVRARVVSNRTGFVGEWRAHDGTAKTEVATVTVQQGELLDFMVDPLEGDNSDGYSWLPSITSAQSNWDAGANFGPPPAPPLSRLILYTQALMMTNEFLFVD